MLHEISLVMISSSIESLCSYRNTSCSSAYEFRTAHIGYTSFAILLKHTLEMLGIATEAAV